MKTSESLIDILIDLENPETGLFSINLVDDSENLIWRMFVDYTGKFSKSESVKPAKHVYLQFVLDNYYKEVIKNLTKLFQLLKEYPEFFSWDEEDKSWLYGEALTASNLVNWEDYEETVILPKIKERNLILVLPKPKKDISKKSSREKDLRDKGSFSPIKPLRSAIPVKKPTTLEKYNKIEMIGKGSYSTVYLVQDNNTRKTFVMKQVRKKAKKAEKIEEELENIAREIAILKKLVKLCKIEDTKIKKNLKKFKPKLNIVPSQNQVVSYFPCFIEEFEEKEHIYIITEHIGNYKNLGEYLKTHQPTLDQIKIIFLNLVRGLQVLHSLGVIHKDIKPGNILINPETLDIQYIDFGLSCWEDEIKCINKGRGTPLYISPEIYYRLSSRTPSKPYSVQTIKKSDIWALGLVFYDMLLGYHPFDHIKTQEDLTSLLVKLYKGIEILPVTNIIDPMFRRVVDGMLQPNPDDRSSLAELENILT